MRKFIALLLVIILSLSLFGCSSKGDMGKTSSIVSNNNRNYLTAEDKDYIYFGRPFDIKKISKKDNSVETIYEMEVGTEQIYEIESFSDKLYLLISSNELVSMEADGTNVEKVELLDLSPSTFYIYDNSLYIILNGESGVVKVNPEDLTFEDADKKIVNQYIATDGTTFIKKKENDLGRVYVLANGEEKLFSGENESVILNRMNFTDSYVFYYAFDMKGVEDSSSLESFNLYRVDLDGGNKKLIKEVDIDQNWGDVKYDNEYIYLYTSADEYLKIHKETLKETNIIDQVNGYDIFEISNERFFNFVGNDFFDSANGKLIELQ